MGLRMKIFGGCCGPVVVCDHCGQEIEDACDGNYCWGGEVADGFHGDRPYFTHKRCHAAFDKAHPDICSMTGELEWLVPYLAYNLGLNWKEARRAAVRASY
jgi:hypothetical protein